MTKSINVFKIASLHISYNINRQCILTYCGMCITNNFLQEKQIPLIRNIQKNISYISMNQAIFFNNVFFFNNLDQRHSVFTL